MRKNLISNKTKGDNDEKSNTKNNTVYVIQWINLFTNDINKITDC